MLLLKGHAERAPIRDLAFSPDSMKLASVARDGSVRLWDLAAGTHEVVVQSESLDVWSVSFSPDGRWLAWTFDQSVYVRDLKKQATRLLWEKEEGCWPLVRFSPEGDTLAVSDANELSLWNVGKWTKPRIREDDRDHGGGDYDSPFEYTSCLAYSPDGEYLATANRLPGPPTSRARYRIRLRHPNNGEILNEMGYPTQDVTSLSFSPDSTKLACTFGSSWEVFDVPAGMDVCGTKIHHREFFAAAFVPDGKHLALSFSDLSVRFFDTETWKQKAAFKWKVGRVKCLTFAPDGMKAAGGGHEGVIAVWDVDL
jgi:hypothetical protein